MRASPCRSHTQSTTHASNRKYQAIDQEVLEGGVSSYLGRFIHRDEIFWREPLNTPDNVGPLSTVTTSSEDATTHELATNAVDGDPGTEWATVGGKEGSWLQLNWPNPVWRE